MSAGATTARGLLERTGEHPVVSVFFDLDPSEFATAPARATQAESLLDGAHNLMAADATLNHDARAFVKGDLERLEAYLASDELPVSDAGALAIYACGAAGVFETIPLGAPAASAVYLERAPHLEPLITQPAAGRWAVALVTSEDAEIYLGHGHSVDAQEHSSRYVRGHRQSVDTTGRVNEHDVDEHLGEVAAALDDDWRRGRFCTLMLGGPIAAATRLEGHLPKDLHGALAAERLDVDTSAVTDATLAEAVARQLTAAEERTRETLLARLADGLGGAGRAVAGVTEVLAALAEQRVQTLLMAGDFHAAGARCSRCGLLFGPEVDECPVDGTATAPVADLREPMLAAAVLQDAGVTVYSEPVPELAPAHPVAALLRF